MGLVLRRSGRRQSARANHAAKGPDTTLCLKWSQVPRVSHRALERGRRQAIASAIRYPFPGSSSLDRCCARLTLLGDESIVGFRSHISLVLGLMHDATGDIIGLSGRHRFPFAAVLPRHKSPLEHRAVLIAGMGMAAS